VNQLFLFITPIYPLGALPPNPRSLSLSTGVEYSQQKNLATLPKSDEALVLSTTGTEAAPVALPQSRILPRSTGDSISSLPRV